MADFRCSTASLADHEPLAGTAPSETAWLCVEYAGAWGRRAVAESRLPDAARAALDSLDGFRVQLVRRPGGRAGRVTVFAATATETGFDVGATTLPDHGAVPALLAGLDPRRPAAGLPAYDGPLLLVCTNGGRDRCCAELGRPVVAALAGRWPESTWETTHLGGHRFAGTLLALPSGLTLGRLGAGQAEAAVRALLDGDPPLDLLRGRAGLTPAGQVADLHVRALRPGTTPHVSPDRPDPERADALVVRVAAGDASYDVTVTRRPGEPRRQSCLDPVPKQTWILSVASMTHVS